MPKSRVLPGKGARLLGRRTIKRRPPRGIIEWKDFRLGDEIDYIRSRAAAHHGRLVTVGPLVLLSTETGDAWLLDPADHLAARLARDGVPEEVYFEETDSNFGIGWKAAIRSTAMPSSTLTMTRPVSPQSSAILPAASLSRPDLPISNIFGWY